MDFTEALTICLNHVPSEDALHVPNRRRTAHATIPIAQLTQDWHRRVLAAPVRAPRNIPSAPTSIKDGFAVIASNETASRARRLAVVGFRRAGDAPPQQQQQQHVDEHSAMYVTTGAVVPKHANAVVEIEKVRILEGGEFIEIPAPGDVSVGQDIRAVGSDTKLGELLFEAGTVLGPGDIGLLASVGLVSVDVYDIPRIAILSTGNELGQLEMDGGIFDCNLPMLLASVVSHGWHAVDLGSVPDDVNALDLCVQRAIRDNVDILVTTGGVSQGDRDFVRPYFSQINTNSTVHFSQVKIKPGKPMTFATIERGPLVPPLLVFCLPGNPCSAFAMFETLVVPCARKIAGWRNPHLRSVKVRLGHDIELDPRPEFQRAKIFSKRVMDDDDLLVAFTSGMQRSSRIQSCVQVDALLRLPGRAEHQPRLKAGDMVEAIILNDWRMSQSLVGNEEIPRTVKINVPTSTIIPPEFTGNSPCLAIVYIAESSLDDFPLYRERYERLIRIPVLDEKTRNLACFKCVMREYAMKSVQQLIMSSYRSHESGLIVLLMNGNVHSKNLGIGTDIVHKLSRVLVPGVGQYLRENNPIEFTQEYSTGIVGSHAILMDMMDHDTPKTEENQLSLVWTLLCKALQTLLLKR